MLSDEVLEKVIEVIANRIEQGNTYVLEQIGKSIKKIGTLTPTKAQELGQILKYGGDYDKIVKKLAEITKLNTRDIKKIFEEVAKKDVNFAKDFYNYRGKKFIPYEKNTALKNQVDAITNIMVDNYIARTKAIGFSVKNKKGDLVFKKLESVYQETIDKAILSVSQGKSTFDSEMYSIIKELGSSGLKTLDYENNRTLRLDSAVRMQMKDALRTLHNETQMIVGKQFDADGVEISTHLFPADDHEEVQGKQFSNKEYKKLQKDGIATTYDNIEIDLHRELKSGETAEGFRPISEYNCYHYVFAIVLGVNKPQYTNKQLQDIREQNNKGFEYEGKHYSMYEGTQLQRQLELEIRKQKDTQIMAKASGEDDLVHESQHNISILTKKYKELSEVSGLPTKMNRMRVPGYKRKHI